MGQVSSSLVLFETTNVDLSRKLVKTKEGSNYNNNFNNNNNDDNEKVSFTVNPVENLLSVSNRRLEKSCGCC